MSSEEIRTPGLYYTVIDGSFRTKVDESHPDAVRREYETKDGGTAVKYERIVSALNGYIEDIKFNDGDFGETINFTLDANPEGKNPIVQFSLSTSYGQDVMKKLPNIDLSQPVRFRPFAFEGDNGKPVRGVEITQGEAKIENHFYNKETKENLHGFPTVPEDARDTFSKNEWKKYFLDVDIFLKQFAEKNVIPKLQFREVKPKPEAVAEAHSTDINPEDIPF